jgi:hypothetical protein
MIDSLLGRGRRRIRPGVCWSNPSATPNGALMKKWIHRTCAGVNGSLAAMLSERRAEEREHERDERDQHEADVLGQVVVELAALLDRAHDRREIVVGEDHPAGVLGNLGAAAHRDPDVGGLDRRRVVDPVSGHRDHVPLLLERVDEQHLVLRCDTADDADPVDPRQSLGLLERSEFRAEDRLPLDPELLRDRRAGNHIVPGHHPSRPPWKRARSRP